jgi:hypothetical protein
VENDKIQKREEEEKRKRRKESKKQKETNIIHVYLYKNNFMFI